MTFREANVASHERGIIRRTCDSLVYFLLGFGLWQSRTQLDAMVGAMLTSSTSNISTEPGGIPCFGAVP